MIDTHSAGSERMIGLLETLVAEQRTMGERQREALANHADAIAAQQALNRQALRWFCTFILVFGAVAAITRAWPSLLWLLASG
ncbi:MAG TPA: hypothetical protein VLR71_06470 [Casimicrobiaceae bacterium]|nr:hypothetical protein [Casimicrobiaceae bacterium]